MNLLVDLTYAYILIGIVCCLGDMIAFFESDIVFGALEVIFVIFFWPLWVYLVLMPSNNNDSEE